MEDNSNMERVIRENYTLKQEIKSLQEMIQKIEQDKNKSWNKLLTKEWTNGLKNLKMM